MNVVVPPVSELSQCLTFTYKWIIDNWISYDEYEPGRFIISPEFQILNSLWYIYIYPNGSSEESKENISASLHRNANFSDVMPIDVRFAFSIAIGGSGLIANHDSLTKSRFSGFIRSWGVNNLIRKSVVMEFIRAASVNQLTVFCKIFTQEESIQETYLRRGNDRALHLQAFENFINNERFSDVKIQVEGKEIFAHKNILSAHSPVFAAMFEHQMRENKENLVRVEDISYQVFYQLLRYIYLGKADFVKETVSELFKAADKYQLTRLRNMCQKEMCKNLSIDNVFVYIRIADMYNAIGLKKEAIDFIATHMIEIIRRPELESLKELDMTLFREILQRVVEQKKP